MVLSILFLYVGNRIAVQDNSYFQSSRAETYYRSEVIAVGEPRIIEQDYDGWSESYTEQDITIRLLEGALRGEEVTVHQQLQTPKEGYKTFPYEVGDRVFAGFNFDSEMNCRLVIADHLREMPMLLLMAAFFALLIGFGRFKGFNTVVSLVLTCAAVFFVMIPAIIKGYNIYLVTFITAVFTIVMTLCIVIGVHPKSIAAAVGCTLWGGLCRTAHHCHAGSPVHHRPGGRGFQLCHVHQCRYGHRSPGSDLCRHRHRGPGGYHGCGHVHRLLPGGDPLSQAGNRGYGADVLRAQHRSGHHGHDGKHPGAGLWWAVRCT